MPPIFTHFTACRCVLPQVPAASARAKLHTGATLSKGWVIATGHLRSSVARESLQYGPIKVREARVFFQKAAFLPIGHFELLWRSEDGSRA